MSLLGFVQVLHNYFHKYFDKYLILFLLDLLLFFQNNNYNQFVTTQTESAVRYVGCKYPYESLDENMHRLGIELNTIDPKIKRNAVGINHNLIPNCTKIKKILNI